MAHLRTDSPISRRIVLAFLDFLNSVEPAPGVDLEGLEVVKECLTEAFKVNSSTVDNRAKPDFLLDIFSSLGGGEQGESKSDFSHGTIPENAPAPSSSQSAADANLSEASKSLDDDWTRESSTLGGASRDELFGQFFAALEKIHFFKTTTDGNDDPVQLEKATRLFHDALTELERSGCRTFDKKSLAESLKSKGNRAMQSKLYSDAIDLYTCAIGLCENNAVYYSNRAAAFTQLHYYTEAVRDCLKSIEIDPNYSKAYSRLGIAYYAQGNYSDAINKGFKKALQLDPNNEHVKENIRVAEQKLREEQQQHNQTTGSGSGSTNPPPIFTSMPFNPTALPGDFANMFMNVAGNAFQGHPQDGTGRGNNPNGFEHQFEFNGSGVGGNVNFSFGEQMPEDLTGALRSAFSMFPGGAAAPNGNPQDDTNGRPAPN